MRIIIIAAVMAIGTSARAADDSQWTVEVDADKPRLRAAVTEMRHCLWHGTFELTWEDSRARIVDVKTQQRPIRTCFEPILWRHVHGPLPPVRFSIVDPDHAAKERARAEAEAEAEAKRAAEQKAREERWAAEQEADRQGRARIDEKCRPKPSTRKGIRFPFGLPDDVTREFLEDCLAGCSDLDDGTTLCFLDDRGDDRWNITFAGLNLSRTPALLFTDSTPAAHLYMVVLAANYEDCDDAAGALGAAWVVVETVYAEKGASIARGPEVKSRACRSLMSPGHMFVRSSTAKWFAEADAGEYRDGHFTINLAITNRAGLKVVAQRQAEKNAKSTREALGKF